MDSGEEFDEQLEKDSAYETEVEVLDEELDISVRRSLGTKQDRENLELLLKLKWLDSNTIKLMR